MTSKPGVIVRRADFQFTKDTEGTKVATYKIRIDGPLNEQVGFAPTGDVLRGAWKNSAVASRDKGQAMNALSAIPVIPGQYISIDTEEGVGLIGDELNTDEGKVILKESNRIMSQYPGEFGSAVREAGDDRIHEALTLDNVKDWVFKMRQLVDAGLAKDDSPGAGGLPTCEEVRKWPGKRTADIYNTGTQDKELSEFADVVEPEPVDVA